MPWKAESLAAVKLAAIFGAGTAGKAADVQAECCTLNKRHCSKIQHKNHLVRHAITLASLNGVFNVNSATSDACGEYSSFPVHEGLNEKLL